MPYGQTTYGEAAYGESVSAFAGGAVDGYALITEASDQVAILGRVPLISLAAIIDTNLLVIVLELEMAYFGEAEPPVEPPVTPSLVFVSGVFATGVFE